MCGGFKCGLIGSFQRGGISRAKPGDEFMDLATNGRQDGGVRKYPFSFLRGNNLDDPARVYR